MKDEKTNADVPQVVEFAEGENYEPVGNYLYKRDAASNALVPVVASYSESETYECIGNNLYLRDAASNALVPVVSGVGGGGTPVPASTEPQPRADWWDIKAIFEAEPSPNKRAIYLVMDANPTIVLNNSSLGAANTTYRTSDGAEYFVAAAGGSVTHTWDDSKAKPCALGYKTRWVMVLNDNRDIACNFYAYDVIWVNFGNANMTSLQGYYNYNGNRLLNYITLSDETTTSLISIEESALKYCSNLKIIHIPKGVKALGSFALNAFYPLEVVKIPMSVTNIAVSAFQSCYGLVMIDIERDWIVPQGLNLTNATSLSLSCFGNFAAKVGVNTGVLITVTFGAVNLARFNSCPEGRAAVALFTAKGYILA